MNISYQEELSFSVSEIKRKSRVILLAGPTATGKTALALEVARALNGEIISADSVQVYRGMNIGTAKAVLEDQLEIPHHLIDVCDLSDSFNVVRFYKAAIECIRAIIGRGRVPIVVGGTGFYLHALLYGPPLGPPSCQSTRDRLSERLGRVGNDVFYAELCEIDPKYASSIHKNDSQKMLRAMEIVSLTGKKVSDFMHFHSKCRVSEWDFQGWFIYFPKTILFPRIEMRCDTMLAKGLLAEVTELLKKNLRENRSASQSIGYRQCIEYLDSPGTDQDWDEFVWNFKRASRLYAKRQFVWFKKRQLDFKWLNLESGVEYIINQIVRFFIR